MKLVGNKIDFNFVCFFMQGLKSIYIKEGTRGLFRGLGPSVLQVAPLTALQFWSYNVVIEYLLDYTKREWVFLIYLNEI